ncbi:MAG: phosphoribosylanthranilate isomerase [Oscillospiraceae bacterium]|nr:phosphoribosylanthranilate isomerase [Oscillospiraceae bacterium]
MTRIKICGLTRPCDIEYVNRAKPDLCGFIIGVPKSRRNVSPETVRTLRASLDPAILPVGVFVNAPVEQITALVRDGTLSVVQLHGQEDERYITALRQTISVPIVQAFSVRTEADVAAAEKSSADHILLDHGSGGTGTAFDWSLLEGISRPYILAGGLNPENLPEAVRRLRPWAVDLSSGVETDGKKDPGKIFAAVQTVKNINMEEQS